MSQTEETMTPHGDVEYETRTCASCGQEHLPEDTRTLYYGSVKDTTQYSSWENISFKRQAKRLYVCEHCEDQPVKYTFPSVVGSRDKLAFVVGWLIGWGVAFVASGVV